MKDYEVDYKLVPPLATSDQSSLDGPDQSWAWPGYNIDYGRNGIHYKAVTHHGSTPVCSQRTSNQVECH